MDELVTEYTTYLASEKMKSNNTIESYGSDVLNYLYYLQNVKGITNLQNVTTEDVKNYLAYLKKWDIHLHLVVGHLAL